MMRQKSIDARDRYKEALSEDLRAAKHAEREERIRRSADGTNRG